ncbi:MAG: bifunctional 2-polyprenyl-6-hydroxyphenol methylase/3-demethylubiquinol 3-O-methyltransferase UbiG [Sphingomonadaceae bacterium]|nr:bifunctional 2-polyprenyl-6-hydroxyphenol methylase/3-demethylubiquinol 3-O-methyltransferase UbiG [Sphingomonadaceae bacterium]
MTRTIRPDEAAHFGALAADWWDADGSSAMLHRLNPARLGWMRDCLNAHFALDPQDFRALAGRRLIDVGCGAGLIAEPMARLGADVTGVDAAAENIAVARAHAAEQGLAIDYRHGDIGDAGFAAALGQFDIVTSMEVIEHVADPAAFLCALAARMAAGGILLLSTPNRTLWSKLLLVEAAERLGQVPRGTHDWQRFLTLDELADMAAAGGLRVLRRDGLGPDFATRGFKAGGSDAINYLVALVKN